VSQQNLLKDHSQEPCLHPQIDVMFNNIGGDYILKKENIH
jgi:heat shock protein HspQ